MGGCRRHRRATTPTKELLEDILEAAATTAAAKPAHAAHAPHTAGTAGAAAVEAAALFGFLEAVVAHLVVGLPFLLVGQHLLCGLDLFELLLGVWLIAHVRVVF
ncbi:MAG: hypothetical protein J07HN4v3_00197 [Halonotius sp. J07HN4]|nr:MAG: hypothetical protein J07HN4v3_00197 [Halonotius sp. J07HN4]